MPRPRSGSICSISSNGIFPSSPGRGKTAIRYDALIASKRADPTINHQQFYRRLLSCGAQRLAAGFYSVQRHRHAWAANCSIASRCNRLSQSASSIADNTIPSWCCERSARRSASSRRQVEYRESAAPPELDGQKDFLEPVGAGRLTRIMETCRSGPGSLLPVRTRRRSGGSKRLQQTGAGNAPCLMRHSRAPAFTRLPPPMPEVMAGAAFGWDEAKDVAALEQALAAHLAVAHVVAVPRRGSESICAQAPDAARAEGDAVALHDLRCRQHGAVRRRRSRSSPISLGMAAATSIRRRSPICSTAQAMSAPSWSPIFTACCATSAPIREACRKRRRADHRGCGAGVRRAGQGRLVGDDRAMPASSASGC